MNPNFHVFLCNLSYLSVTINGSPARTRRIIDHESADVSLIKLARQSDTSICLPPPSFCIDGKPSTCIVTSPDGRIETQVEPQDELRCSRGYGVAMNPLYESCARSGSFTDKNGCDFAPGSPVMCRYPNDDTWVLYGIINVVKTCGKEDASTFTKFKFISDWVNRYQSIDSGLSAQEESETCDPFSSRGVKDLPADDDAKGWQKEGICGVPDIQAGFLEKNFAKQGWGGMDEIAQESLLSPFLPH